MIGMVEVEVLAEGFAEGLVEGMVEPACAFLVHAVAFHALHSLKAPSCYSPTSSTSLLRCRY